MTVLVWRAELNTGIDEIDRQHRRIVDYINQLYELISSKDRDGIGDVIYETVDYTVSHFVFEESLMDSAGYVFSPAHKKVHELFTRRVLDIQTRFKAGEDVAEELHKLLSRWLFNHIRNEDYGYIEAAQVYLRMAGGGRSSAEADRLKALEHKRPNKGWLARLLGS